MDIKEKEHMLLGLCSKVLTLSLPFHSSSQLTPVSLSFFIYNMKRRITPTGLLGRLSEVTTLCTVTSTLSLRKSEPKKNG